MKKYSCQRAAKGKTAYRTPAVFRSKKTIINQQQKTKKRPRAQAGD